MSPQVDVWVNSTPESARGTSVSNHSSYDNGSHRARRGPKFPRRDLARPRTALPEEKELRAVHGAHLGFFGHGGTGI